MKPDDDKIIKEIEKSDSVLLYKKILATQSLVANVEKDGRNDFQKYNYAKWEDIVKSVRRAAIECGLLISINTKNKKSITDDGQTNTEVEISIELIDTNTGYSIEHSFFGEGRDKGDKSIYKAYTGAVKYAIIEIFLVPIGEDPESEGKNAPDLLTEKVKQLQNEKVKLQKEVLTTKCKLIPEELNKTFKALKYNGGQAVKFIEKYNKDGVYDWVKIKEELNKLKPVSKDDIAKALKSIPKDILEYFQEKKYSEKEQYKRITSLEMDWVKIRLAIKGKND